MLYAPFLTVALAGPRPLEWAPAAGLFVAITGAFLLQNALVLALRGKGSRGTRLWLVLYATLTLSALAALVTGPMLLELTWIGVPTLGILSLYLWLRVASTRKRAHLTLPAQVASVVALTMTGPLAAIVLHGGLAPWVFAVQVGWILFFVSGVLTVRAKLGALRLRRRFPEERRRLVRPVKLYHAGLVAVLLVVASLWGGVGAAMLSAAVLPVLIRAGVRVIRLDPEPTSFVRIGLVELGLTLWALGWTVALLIQSPPAP